MITLFYLNLKKNEAAPKSSSHVIADLAVQFLKTGKYKPVTTANNYVEQQIR